jgi:hypothetical protein
MSASMLGISASQHQQQHHQNQSQMKSMTIYLSDGENIRDFIHKELRSRLSKRYKMTHLAEDMNLRYYTLNRFMRGQGAGDEFYIQAFNFLMK